MTTPDLTESAAAGLRRLIDLREALRAEDADHAALIADLIGSARAIDELAAAFVVHRNEYGAALMRARVRGASGHLDELHDRVEERAESIESGPGASGPENGPDPDDASGYLAVTTGGKVLAVLRNAIEILDRDPYWSGLDHDPGRFGDDPGQFGDGAVPARHRLRLDQFTGRVLIDGREKTDVDECEAVAWVSHRYGADIPTHTLYEAMSTVAARRPYHVVREYFGGLVWDRKPRLATWLHVYGGCEPHVIDPDYDSDSNPPPDLVAAYGTRWLISAVARVYRPGCQADSALVLQGAKGMKKTTLFRVLGGEWYSETPIDIGTKDGMQQLQGVLVYELGELDSLKRSEVSAIKLFISTTVDKFRPPYGRNTISWPRQCVFGGSTNDETFLQESDRRWWVRRVVRRADIPRLREDRDQLWAEAVHLYNEGVQWHLLPEEEDAQAEDVEQYRHVDPWERLIAAYVVQYPGPYRIGDVARRALEITSVKLERADEMRIGRVLARMGLTRHRPRGATGGREYVYSWPVTTP